MTGALSFAINHASLVEALEETAPPVESRYLREAIERCKLPIKIKCNGRGEISGRIDEATVRDRDICGQTGFKTPGAHHATLAYLALCNSLSPAVDAPPTLSGGATGADATATVAESAPLSFESAAPRPLPLADAPEATAAVALGADSPSAPSASIPGVRA